MIALSEEPKRVRVDGLGRVVMPSRIRKDLNVEPRQSYEILIDEEKLVLQRSEDKCLFCGMTAEIFEFKNLIVCRNCASGVGGGTRFRPIHLDQPTTLD